MDNSVMDAIVDDSCCSCGETVFVREGQYIEERNEAQETIAIHFYCLGCLASISYQDGLNAGVTN